MSPEQQINEHLRKVGSKQSFKSLQQQAPKIAQAWESSLEQPKPKRDLSIKPRNNE